MDALILCGGEGTRIRHLLPEGTPKIMADINGTPFARIFSAHLLESGFERLFFLAGHNSGLLARYVEDSEAPWRVIIEYDFLGTAGTIKNAARWFNADLFWIFNGDTFCDVDYKAMLAYHGVTNSTITVACDREFKHVGTFIATKKFVDLIPKVNGKVDMAEVFTLLGQRHEPVGWFMTDAPFYDMGSPEGLSVFRDYWKNV